MQNKKYANFHVNSHLELFVATLNPLAAVFLAIIIIIITAFL